MLSDLVQAQIDTQGIKPIEVVRRARHSGKRLSVSTIQKILSTAATKSGQQIRRETKAARSDNASVIRYQLMEQLDRAHLLRFSGRRLSYTG